MTALRFDIGGLRPCHRTDEGYLVCDAIVSRTGVFPYRNADGSTRYEARLREDVTDPASLESLAGKPVTLTHPRDDDGVPVMMSPDLIAKHSVGTVGTELVELGGGQIRAQLIIHRRDAIDAIEASNVRGVSPGYNVREDRSPGTLGNQRYDLAQRDIRYNHVAIVPVGRQGITLRADESAAYSARLDADDVEAFPLDTTPQGEPMSTARVRIDGSEYEVPAAVAPAITQLTQRVDALNTAVDGHKERADKAEADLATVTGERDAARAALKEREDNAETEADRIAWAKERAHVLEVAKACKVDVAEDATNDDIKRAVVAARIDSAPKDASAEYVNGSFSALAANLPREDAGVGKAFERKDGAPPAKPTDFATRMDAATVAYEKHLTGADA